MASAAEVPSKYDLVISDGTTTVGYVLFDAYRSDANAPEKAVHSFSPVFVPRTNIEGNYGDDKQEFFLTFSQKDWSLGEEQKYARASDSTSRRYYRGSAVDVRTSGEVKMRKAITTINSDAVLLKVGLAIERGTHATAWAWVDADSIFTYNSSTGSESDPTPHGLTAPTALATDGVHLYVSQGDESVERWDFSASVTTTFSATGADSLAFLNNAMYGYRDNAGTLVRYSTAGTATTLHTWQDATGTAITVRGSSVLQQFGGKLLIGFPAKKTAGGSELWIYDGVGVSLVHQWKSGFELFDMTVHSGVVYLSGKEGARAVVYYYANGQIGLLWRSDAEDSWIGSFTKIATHGSGVVFTERTSSTNVRILFYSPSGGVSTIADVTTIAADGINFIANSYGFALIVLGTDDVYAYRALSAATATTATVTSSLIDFDSSLQKYFRGIKIDYDEADDGDGGSVDIAYRLNDLTSTYTTLQTGAVSGTEYTLGTVGSEIMGRSISVKCTLNKGTSTDGPILKRIYVRAAPRVNSFHKSAATLNLTGVDGTSPVVLRDGSMEPRDGLELAHTLKEFVQTEGLLTITDKFGSRVSTIENCEFIEIRPNEFIANIVFRQV